MRPVALAIAVLTLAGFSSGAWSAHDDSDAPGVRDRSRGTAPAGPGRKGASPARPSGDAPLPGETAPRRRNDARARQQQDAWREAHPGKAYRYETDDEHRLVFATCIEPASHEEMRRMLVAQAEQQAAYLFDALPDTEVFIAVATPADVRKEFSDSPTTAGMYEHPRRRIITADIGTPLRHEWTHAMHFGHMERLGQPHVMWVQEGLAALYESYQLLPDGGIRFLPTQRHNEARKVASSRRALSLAQLLAMSPDDFMGRSQATYPVARSVFEFMADQGKLRAWYRKYVDTFAKDRTGRTAIEDCFGCTLDEFERDWRKWTLARPAVDVTVGDGDRSIGVDVRAATDGVEVTDVERGSAAHAAGLRRGDVIVAIDGDAVRSPREWAQATGALRGAQVTVTVRRDGKRADVVIAFDRQASLPTVPARGFDRPGIRTALLHRARPESES